MAMMAKQLPVKMTTMTFDINAVFAQAINRGLTSYKNQLFTTPEQADKLKPKHAAILKSIEESFRYPHLHVEAVQLFLDLFPIFERWGYWAECIYISETALDLALPVATQVYLYANLGHMHHLNRNFDDSLRCLNRALQIAEKHQLETVLGLIHHRFMNTYIGQEDHLTAKNHGLQALAYLAGPPSKTLAAAYDSLGRTFMDLKDLPMAEKYFWDALSLWDNLKDYTHMARSYLNLGSFYFGQRKLVEAQKCYESSLAALGNLSNIVDELRARIGLGIVYHTNGDFEKAVAIFREGANRLESELGEKVGWYSIRGSLLHNLGNSQLALGEPQQAILNLYKARTIWHQANNQLEMANTVGTIAEAYQAEEEWETAVTTYTEALILLANYPNHPWAIKLTQDFSKARKTCADHLDSLDSFEE